MKFKLLLLPEVFNNWLLKTNQWKRSKMTKFWPDWCSADTLAWGQEENGSLYGSVSREAVGSWAPREWQASLWFEEEEMLGMWTWMATLVAPCSLASHPSLQRSTSGVGFQRQMATSDCPFLDASDRGPYHWLVQQQVRGQWVKWNQTSQELSPHSMRHVHLISEGTGWEDMNQG